MFRDVQLDRLEPVLDGIPVQEVPKGRLLNTPGVEPGRLHLVLQGRLRAYQMSADGHELLLELIPEGGFDGLLSVAGRRGHFTEADADSTIVSIGPPALERLIELEPRVASNLMRLIIERLEGREAHLQAVVLHDPTQRLARQLLALGETLGRRREGSGGIALGPRITHQMLADMLGVRREGSDGIALGPRITHQMLADMLGVRRETVTLHIGRLVDLGALKVEKGRFILEPDALKRIVDDPHVGRRA